MSQVRDPRLVYFPGAFSRVERQEDGRLLVAGTVVTETPVVQKMPDGRVRPVILDYGAAVVAADTYARNIREQHDPKLAVGRAIDVHLDEADRTIGLTAFVSKGAPNTQEKVRDGTLRSYSIGCDPTAWKDEGETTRVTAFEWIETSLVDVGADPNTNDLILLARGAHLEAALIGQEDIMSKPAAAAVTETAPPVVPPVAPTPESLNVTRTVIGGKEVVIDASGAAKVIPPPVAADPPAAAAPPPVVAKTADLVGSGVNRFARAMEEATAAKADDTEDEPADGEKAEDDTPPPKKGEKADTENVSEIANAADLMDAIRGMSSSKDPAGEKAKIKAAAKKLNLVDKLPRSWRAAKPEMVRATIAGLQRYMEGGNETDDLSLAICILRSLGWVSRDVEYLIASEMAEGLAGEPADAAQITLLQSALASLGAASLALKEFIGDEASEGTVAAGPDPAADAGSGDGADLTDAADVEMSARPVMVRGLARLSRRIAGLESKISAAPKAEPFTPTDGEELAAAIARNSAATLGPIVKALGDLDRGIKAVSDDLDKVLALPKPYGAARRGPVAGVTRGASGGDVPAEYRVRVLRDAVSSAPDVVSRAHSQHLLAIAEMELGLQR